MAHKNFLIHYSTGIKRYVSRDERDSLDYLHGLKQIGPREYSCQLQVIKCANLKDMEPVRASIEVGLKNAPKYLPGSWIFEINEQRFKEFMESEFGLTIRMR